MNIFYPESILNEAAFPFIGKMNLYHGTRKSFKGRTIKAGMLVGSNRFEKGEKPGVFFWDNLQAAINWSFYLLTVDEFRNYVLKKRGNRSRF